MRPRIVEFLTELTGFQGINFIVPTGLAIYIVALGTVALVFYNRCRQVDLPHKHAMRVSIITILFAVIGVRLFNMLETLFTSGVKPHSWLSLGGGTTSWGAYFFGFAAFCFYLIYYKQPLLKYADIFGSALGLGPFIGRWACFFNGCCYGKESNFFCAVRFPQFSPAYNAQWKAGMINLDTPLSLPVHPFQLYASLAALLIFIIVGKIYRRYRDRTGITIASYGLLYGFVRFFIEFFRGDVPRYTILELTVGQCMCTMIVLFSIGGLWLLQKRYRMPKHTGKNSIS
jgi:phosphatidylglycerol:prolipoprotein diacylglycerol transferase